VAPINPVRIRLRYPDLETFVQKFAPNVTRGGVFLASRNLHPVGAAISFEIQLAGGEIVLAGDGKVSWVKDYNPAEPGRPYGMGVQFVSLESATKPILARVLRAKEAHAQATRQTTADAATAAGPGAGGAPASNGKTAAPAIDTSVDLAAEFGLEDTVVRRVIDRTWMSGARGADDLADLMKPEPLEPITLAQALVELPRLLDPQFSRRRASGGLRSPESGPVVNSAPTTAVITSSGPIAVAHAAGRPSVAPEMASETTQQNMEASDTTDMSDVRDPVDSMPAVAGEIDSGPSDNGRRARKRRG
jgi:uncharacterized protein (TIGR02266 family)